MLENFQIMQINFLFFEKKQKVKKEWKKCEGQTFQEV